MAFLFRMVCLGVLISVVPEPQPRPVELKTGDVVFQTSKSARSALIRRASDSPYSHVGLVEVTPTGIFVIEAIAPVSRTPWARWYARGVGSKFTVIRVKGATAPALDQVVTEAKRYVGRPYDARYRWDDERLYCSELVSKAFAVIGVDAGVAEKIESLNLSAEELRSAPSLGIDVKQTLVTPASIAKDDDFETVYSTY